MQNPVKYLTWCASNQLFSFSSECISFPCFVTIKLNPVNAFTLAPGKMLVIISRGCWRDAAATAAKSLQPCLTLYNPIDGSPAGSPVPGVGCHLLLQCIKVKVKSLSRVRPSATPWTAAYQAPLSMGFSRREYWSGLPLPSLLPDLYQL